MSTRKTITLHLEPREYAQLKAKARRESMDPDALVRFLVDDVLRNDEDAAEQHKQAMHDALDRLAATMPSFDAEKLVREGRDEFDKRSST